jgi:ankyrin repeat protein
MDEGNIQSLIEKTEEVVRGLPSIPSTPQNNSRYVSEFVQMQLDGASDSLIRAMYNYDYHKSKSYNSFSSSPGYEIHYSSLRSKSLYYFFRSTGEFIQNSVRFGLGLDEGLAWAAMAGHVNIVDELLDHGASINATFYAEVEQIPVINSLVYMNNLEMVEHFLNRGAEVPYHYTISINRSDADYWEVRKPIAKLFNHSLKGEMVHANNLPDMLIYAGMAGDNKRVEELLGFASRHGYNLAVELALNVAVFTKNSDFIEQLLSFPELSLREGYFSEALGHAIRYELLPLIAQLLEINADPFAYESLGEGTYGENAVEKAIKHPNKDVLKKMVETIPQLSVALLIQAIENEDHSTVDSWLASYNGSEFEQDFPGLQDALATAISKNDPVSFRKIIALPEGEQLLYKKYKGVELFDLAHNIEIKEFILIRTGFFDKVSPQFLDLLLESLSSGFKEQAELLIDNIPKQGFLVHDFQEHLNVSRKKDFSLYARLQRKIKELSDSQDW